MTTYGTIPTTTTTTTTTTTPPQPPPKPIPIPIPISTDLQFVSLAKERIKSGLGTRRPWLDMFLVPAFSVPETIGEALHRMGPNIMYYRMNYVIIVLSFLFLGLLWDPTSMIFFICVMFAWLFLYFLRDDTLVVYGYEVNDRIVMLGLSVVTVLGLVVTNARSNMSVSLCCGAVAVLAHAAFREGEEVVIEDGGDGQSSKTTKGKASMTLPVKQPSSVKASMTLPVKQPSSSSTPLVK